MLKQTQKDELKKIGIDIDAVFAAYSDAAEKDITIPAGEFLTADQLAARDTNTKTEGIKEGKKEGEKAALTIAIAEINKNTGLAIDAAKIERFGDLGKALKDELHKTSDDKTKQIAEQNRLLIADKEMLTSELATAKTTADKTVFEFKQFQYLPENRNKTMNESEYLQLLGSRGVEVKADGVYRNGEVMKDATTKGALPHKDAYKQLFEEYKWTAEPPAGAQGGRGGGNSNPGVGGKARTQSEAIKKWEDANPGLNPASPEASAFVQAEAKDNPAFAWHE